MVKLVEQMLSLHEQLAAARTPQEQAALRDRLSAQTEQATMIKELDDVILACDLPEHGLSAGDIGTVVLVHRGNRGYEVEFTTVDGETIAVVTLLARQVRPAQAGEIAHVRELVAA
jgi:hypothetical protein